jgi:hypothetical protein
VLKYKHFCPFFIFSLDKQKTASALMFLEKKRRKKEKYKRAKRQVATKNYFQKG